jgi:hypothetical protein
MGTVVGRGVRDKVFARGWIYGVLGTHMVLRTYGGLRQEANSRYRIFNKPHSSNQLLRTVGFRSKPLAYALVEAILPHRET